MKKLIVLAAFLLAGGLWVARPQQQFDDPQPVWCNPDTCADATPTPEPVWCDPWGCYPFPTPEPTPPHP